MAFSWYGANRTLGVLKSIPAVARDYSAIATIEGPQDLSRVPVITEKKYLQVMRHIWQRMPPPHSAHIFMSSGSTGEPKIGMHPAHQYIPSIAAVWEPLPTERNLFIDFATAGKACAASHFFRELCHYQGFVSLNLGGITSRDELDAVWSRIIREANATAVGGTPTQLEFIASYFADRHETLDSVKSVVWLSEPLKQHHEACIRAVFPNAGLWSVYGSIETWVIGYQTPEMARDEYLILPYQHIEQKGEDLLITCLHPEIINPILRYVLHDRIQVVEQDEFGAVRRMIVVGRSDNRIVVDGYNLTPDLIVSTTNKIPGIRDSQIIFTREKGAVKDIELRLAKQDRDVVVSRTAILKSLMAADPENIVLLERLVVNEHEGLIVNNRTGKCPARVFRDAP
jgi:phenylacetate-coenzyme A ligase PaaK-like adenylate-forming protein